MRPIAGFLFAVLLVSPRLGAAQTPAPQATDPQLRPSRLSVDVNLVGMAASQARDRQFQTQFIQYGEIATFKSQYPRPATPSFAALSDVSAAYAVKPRFALGGGFSQVSYDDAATVTASIPHPLFFGANASGSGPTASLHRRENAVNMTFTVSAVRTERYDWRVFGGPSYFWYSAEMANNVLYTQTAGSSISQNAVTVDGAESRSADGTAFGLHYGSDFAYFVHPRMALTGGVFVGYGTVKIREPLSKIDQDIRVGSIRVFMGVRFVLGH